MKRDIAIHLLRQENAKLKQQYGIKSLSLFGSVARDEATGDSDIDLLVEFERPTGYFGLFALQHHLEKVLGCPVDLGTPDSLKPRIRERVMMECIRVAETLARTNPGHSGRHCRNPVLHTGHGFRIFSR